MAFSLTLILVLLAPMVFAAGNEDRAGNVETGEPSNQGEEEDPDDAVTVIPRHGFKAKFFSSTLLDSNADNGFHFEVSTPLGRKLAELLEVEYDDDTCKCYKLQQFEITNLQTRKTTKGNLRICEYCDKRFHVGKESEEEEYIAYLPPARANA